MPTTRRPLAYPDTRQFVRRAARADAARISISASPTASKPSCFTTTRRLRDRHANAGQQVQSHAHGQARKVKADGNGNETPMALHDYIEIGVFSGKKDEEKPLYLKKEKITQPSEDLRDRGRSNANARRHRSLQQADRPRRRRQYDRCHQTVGQPRHTAAGRTDSSKATRFTPCRSSLPVPSMGIASTT